MLQTRSVAAVASRTTAALLRASCPLVAPRLAGQLAAVWMHYAFFQVRFTVAAIDGYAEAQRAVLRPAGSPLMARRPVLRIVE
jgi:hypothetical protein